VDTLRQQALEVRTQYAVVREDLAYLRQAILHPEEYEGRDFGPPVTVEACGSTWVVTDTLHGTDCDGCMRMADSAAVMAGSTGSVGSTSSETEVIKAEDAGNPTPPLAHKATVARVAQDA
jgi:hypothetical protein